MADTRPPAGGEWEQVVSEATEHVQARGAAQVAAEDKQKPKSQGPKIAVLSVLLVVAVAMDIWMWTKLPDPMPADEERQHMAWTVVDVVDAVEDFRSDEGRLPTVDEIADVLDEDVAYQVVGETYAVTISGEAGSITFDGAQDVESWARNAWSTNPTEGGS